MDFQIIIQVVIAAGLINVWLLRFRKKTPYRGRGAMNMKEEFKAYGLPLWFMYGIGFTKLTIAFLMILGIWVNAVVIPAAGLLFLLMLGAIAMHVKVKDRIFQMAPAIIMTVLALLLVAL